MAPLRCGLTYLSPVLPGAGSRLYIFLVGVQPFFDHTLRSALSPPHTSRAPGFNPLAAVARGVSKEIHLEVF